MLSVTFSQISNNKVAKLEISDLQRAVGNVTSCRPVVLADSQALIAPLIIGQ